MAGPVWRILMVEDDPGWQQAVSTLLGQRPDVEIIGPADSFDAALALIQAEWPRIDLASLDFNLLGDRTGLDVARALTALGLPEERITMVTSASPGELGEHPFAVVPKREVFERLPRQVDEMISFAERA